MKMQVKRVASILLVCTISGAAGLAAQKVIKKKKTAQVAAKPMRPTTASVRGASKPAPIRPVSRVLTPIETELARALDLAKRGDYANASIRLFNMTRNPRFAEQRMRIKYILGLMFYEMRMYQVAAFQFVDVVRQSDARYLKQALQKLSLAGDILNDDTLLNYAISKVDVEDFPKTNRDMLRFRIGEYYMRKKNYKAASDNFAAVPQSSTYFAKAKYLQGVTLALQNNLDGALRAYSELVAFRQTAGPTDMDRVVGLMGMARIYYQQKKWDMAIDLYRQIPRDTDYWHDSLFEQSWAFMRSARFRSVLSNLHSLHSPYYEDFYLPESILLRGIVYLYICQYDEMEKTLGLFQRIYQPVEMSLDNFLKSNSMPESYFNEMERVIKNFDTLKGDKDARRGYPLQFLITRDIMREGDFKHNYTYLGRLRAEQDLINRQSTIWKKASVGVYASKLIKGRIDTTIKLTGNVVRTHMVAMRNELADLFEQYSFARYEMLNGKKEALKKKIQGKGILSKQIDEDTNRDFYIQNGFEYYPFKGEYWLDEIGNYHYLGTQGCD